MLGKFPEMNSYLYVSLVHISEGHLFIFGTMLPYKQCDSYSQSWPCGMRGFRLALHPLFLTISFVLIFIHLVTGSTE